VTGTARRVESCVIMQRMMSALRGSVDWTPGSAAAMIGLRFNLLAPELFFLILAHPVYKMRITQEPNKLEL
jgi:hypothetical protein